ncbi:MAG TPA: YbjN domain-containing protein [Blastocatellia bacterium]|nr:YbjN domain-containing protein [Blastocatellia bacterium]
MRKRIASGVLASALLALAPGPTEPREIGIEVLRGYLDRLGASYVKHPKSENAVVVTRTGNDRADRLDLYVELREDHTLVLTAYAKEKDRYFSVSRAVNREKLSERLLQANHEAFATFFIDSQGDIGARFTFTTENGVGFEAFRVAATELLRIADDYTPILEDFMRKG